MEIVSFHVIASCWFASRHTSHIGIITYYCQTTFHS